MKTNLEEFLYQCHKAGIKMTEQRMTIAQAILESANHPDIDAIYSFAKQQDTSISLATTYRMIKLLLNKNIIHKLEFVDEKPKYEFSHSHHHHLIDVDSGEVIEFKNNELEKIKENIAKDLGYELTHHRLELYGKKISKNK